MTKDELKNLIEKHGLGACWEALHQRLAPETQMVVQHAKFDTTPVGNTKWGGTPDLPSCISWPKFKRRGIEGLRNTSKPMTFLMQVRCSDIVPFDTNKFFPDCGLLAFFVAIDHGKLFRDENDRVIGQVIYSSGGTVDNSGMVSVERGEFPQGLYYACRLKPGMIKLVQSYSFDTGELEEIAITSFGYTFELHDQLSLLHDELANRNDQHKLFGKPTSFQVDVFEECRLLTEQKKRQYSLPNQSSDWLLLAEIQLAELSDTLTDETGRLYYMIPRTDLAQWRFENPVIVHDSPQVGE